MGMIEFSRLSSLIAIIVEMVSMLLTESKEVILLCTVWASCRACSERIQGSVRLPRAAEKFL